MYPLITNFLTAVDQRFPPGTGPLAGLIMAVAALR
jgi:hypothetical protein